MSFASPTDMIIRAAAVALLCPLAFACSPHAESHAKAAKPADAPARLNDASTAKDIHNALIIPGSEALFAAESAPPETDQQWADLLGSAEKVIQGVALMKTGSRPQGREEWIEAADVVETNTRLTADALARKDASSMVFTDGDMMAGCTSCHQQFRFTTPATATEPAH